MPKNPKKEFWKGIFVAIQFLLFWTVRRMLVPTRNFLEYMRSIARLAKEYGKSEADQVSIRNCYFCKKMLQRRI